MRRILETVGAGVFAGVILKAMEAYGGINFMKSIYQTFLVELWPMWIGILVGLSYWIIRDYIRMRRFNHKLEKWIGLFSYKDRYFDLKGKIQTYIRDELDKNKEAR